ncbi:hypothetical protein Drorol1_Dr00005205 [Drosera rotundifolia]
MKSKYLIISNPTIVNYSFGRILNFIKRNSHRLQLFTAREEAVADHQSVNAKRTRAHDSILLSSSSSRKQQKPITIKTNPNNRNHSPPHHTFTPTRHPLLSLFSSSSQFSPIFSIISDPSMSPLLGFQT